MDDASQNGLRTGAAGKYVNFELLLYKLKIIKEFMIDSQSVISEIVVINGCLEDSTETGRYCL